MNWQEVLSEFGDTGNTCKEMAEEISLLRQRLGPAGYEMLLELKRLREDNEELDGIVNRTEFRSTLEQQTQLERKLARSEYKRSVLREALLGVLAVADRKTKEFDAAYEAIVIDATDDTK